ncbi:MAG: SDR family NAD(P)-dependent oxidoreductase [Clostridium sp.]|nr:SDR family NAD(P)-dependent oxidoreductase [Clostridium sp.]
MRTAIVTGASRGIGLKITRKLLFMGFRVYGFARNFSKCDFNNDEFFKVRCDITKSSILVEKLKSIRNNEDVYILVNNAGIGYFGPHEELNPKKIHDMVATNLEAPILISNVLLRELKKNSGYIINISSITAKKSSTYGCAYSATKAGLTHFSESLFDETRKYGVKVVTIHPDIAKTDFYENANFRQADIEESYITDDCIANTVEFVLNQRAGTVVTDISIQPQKHMIKRK